MARTGFRGPIVQRMGAERDTNGKPTVWSMGTIYVSFLGDASSYATKEKLPAGARILRAWSLDPAPGSGTLQLYLSDGTPADICAAGTTAAVGSKTVAAATLGVAFTTDRPIAATVTSGSASDTWRIALEVIAPFTVAPWS